MRAGMYSEGNVLKSLMFTLLFVMQFLTAPAHAAETPPLPSTTYSDNALIMIANPDGFYHVFLGQRPLSAIQLTYLLAEQDPSFRELERQLRTQQAGHVVGGVFVGLLGVSATLFSGLYMGLTIAWGAPMGTALFGLGACAGVALIYGGYRLASMQIQPFKVWSQSEVKGLVNGYNRGLLRHLSRRAFPIRMRFVLGGNSLGLIGNF